MKNRELIKIASQFCDNQGPSYNRRTQDLLRAFSNAFTRFRVFFTALSSDDRSRLSDPFQRRLEKEKESKKKKRKRKKQSIIVARDESRTNLLANMSQKKKKKKKSQYHFLQRDRSTYYIYICTSLYDKTFSTINRLIIERGSYTITRKFQEVGEEDSKKRDTPERYKRESKGFSLSFTELLLVVYNRIGELYARKKPSFLTRE